MNRRRNDWKKIEHILNSGTVGFNAKKKEKHVIMLYFKILIEFCPRINKKCKKYIIKC